MRRGRRAPDDRIRGMIDCLIVIEADRKRRDAEKIVTGPLLTHDWIADRIMKLGRLGRLLEVARQDRTLEASGLARYQGNDPRDEPAQRSLKLSRSP